MRPVRFTLTDGGTYDGKIIPLDIYGPSSRVSVSCDVTGTVNYTVQYTLSNIWDPTVTPLWTDFPVAALVGATADQAGTMDGPVTALRVNQASGAGSVVVNIVQQSTQ